MSNRPVDVCVVNEPDDLVAEQSQTETPPLGPEITALGPRFTKNYEALNSNLNAYTRDKF